MRAMVIITLVCERDIAFSEILWYYTITNHPIHSR